MQKFKLINSDGKEATLISKGPVFPYQRASVLAALCGFSIYRIEEIK